MQITIDVTPRAAKAFGALITVGTLIGVLAACGTNSNGNQQDASDTASQQDTYNNGGQRAHSYARSQIRATLQTVEDIEANGIATTSFMLNKTGTLNHQCPSIGMPVPSTDQLTNPLATQWGNQSSGVVAQMEKTGVYTGDSSGTFVLCVRPNGTTYVDYWEGDVNAVSAPSHWDQGTGQIVVDGDSTVAPIRTPKN